MVLRLPITTASFDISRFDMCCFCITVLFFPLTGPIDCHLNKLIVPRRGRTIEARKAPSHWSPTSFRIHLSLVYHLVSPHIVCVPRKHCQMTRREIYFERYRNGIEILSIIPTTATVLFYAHSSGGTCKRVCWR